MEDDWMDPKDICNALRKMGYKARYNKTAADFDVNMGNDTKTEEKVGFQGVVILRPRRVDRSQWQLVYIAPEVALEARNKLGTKNGDKFTFPSKFTSGKGENEKKHSLSINVPSFQEGEIKLSTGNYEIPASSVAVSYQGGNLSLSEITQELKKLAGSGHKNSPTTPVASANPIIYAEDIDPDDQIHEGAKKQITVNSYERDPRARKLCLAHYGSAKCQVCEMDFAADYGDIGTDYIHVHHIKPLSDIKGSYVVKPATDLIPVCPNCHAMLHKKEPPFTVEELKTMRKAARGES